MLKNIKDLFRRKTEYEKTKILIGKLLSFKLVKVMLVLIFLAIIVPLVTFFVVKPKPHPDIRYGITFSSRYSTEIGQDWRDTYLKILDDLKPDNMRLVAYWDEIEPENNKFIYDDLMWQVEEAQKRNVGVILAVGRKVPRWPECFEPTWWLPLNEEQREQELLEFIETTVTTFSNFNNIRMWQVENEPFFPFGICEEIKLETVQKEVELVRSLDASRPILIQDSGEGGTWHTSYKLGDYLGISMYRKIWFDFWGLLFGESVYFKYPLAHWTYKIKADLLGVPYEKIIVTELQAEPWGPGINTELTQEQKDKTMSRTDFLDTMGYAQKAGFQELYLWGAEWWLWEKESNNNPFFWDSARALFN